MTIDGSRIAVDKISISKDARCAGSATIWTCTLGDVRPGQTIPSLGLIYFDPTRTGFTGSAGSFTVEVTADQDVTVSPKQTIPVTVVPQAIDIRVRDAFDINAPQRQGAPAEVVFALERVSPFAAAVPGIRVHVVLPRFVTFTGRALGCHYNATNTEATCVRRLGPFDRLELEEPLLATVADNAPGPVYLTGGRVTVDPVNATEGEPDPVDADPSDNAAEFSAHNPLTNPGAARATHAA